MSKNQFFRTNVLLTRQQDGRLNKVREVTGLSKAEIIRRAIDEYLDRFATSKTNSYFSGGVDVQFDKTIQKAGN